MLFLPITRGAAVMVCDEVCLRRVVDRVFAPEAMAFDASELCVTCHACGLTRPGHRCFCAELGVSCSAPSWLLTSEPHAALDAIFASYGPVSLTDADWRFLLDRAEEVDAGGLVGLLWVRERQTETGS